MKQNIFAPRFRIRTKLLFTILTSVIVTLLIFGMLLFHSSNVELIKEAGNTYTQTTKQISITVSEYISRIDQTNRMVDNSEAIPKFLRHEIISNDENDENIFELENNALRSVEQISRSNEDIYSYSIVTMSGKSLSFTDNKSDRMTADINSDYYAALRKSTGNTVVLPRKKAEYSFSPSIPVFTVAFKHIDVETEGQQSIGSYTGYVISECPVTRLQDICSNMNFDSGTNIYVIDNNNGLVYSTETDEKAIKDTVKLFSEKEIGIRTNVGGSESILISSEVGDTGWNIVAVLPYKLIGSNSRSLKTVFIMLCIISVILIFIITVVISYSFTRPIHILRSAMKSVELGDAETQITEKRTDEFGELYDGFNQLISKLNDVIETVADAKDKENIAKYKMLQSQINPHFLYNTIDTIRMMAVIDDNADVAAALLHLSSLFRYNVKESDKLVTVSDELEQSKHYLSLQKLRMGSKLSIEYDIDNDIVSSKIPKMLLQPILENCFTHGFSEAEPPYEITIEVKKHNGFAIFTVKDNGVGIPHERLSLLKAELDNGNSSSIGLQNVNERLKIYFSDDCKLKLESEENVGTKISFKIPILTNNNYSLYSKKR